MFFLSIFVLCLCTEKICAGNQNKKRKQQNKKTRRETGHFNNKYKQHQQGNTKKNQKSKKNKNQNSLVLKISRKQGDKRRDV